MNIIDIINRKRLGLELDKEEIEYFVDSYVNESITDYQMGALLMAICINDMTNQEVFYLTEAMLNSGDIIDLSSLDSIIVDKHSTGGVGDKTTMVVAPLAASCGVKIAKMSGRGLGFTGGTVDKLMSIPGFNMQFSTEEFINQVKEIGICLATDNKNLVPADKKMYQLRDVTATVESIPLIASSIMSKKLASGCNKIVIDLKVGNGALIKNIDDASKLAKLMIEIGKYFNKEVLCVLSNMDEPLGSAVGNAIEVKEAIYILQGKGPEDVTRLCMYLASHMVMLGKNIPINSAMKEVSENIINGKAYEKFKELVKYQHGSLDNLHISENKIDVLSKDSGYIVDIDTFELARIVNEMGAGRLTIDDEIDPSVGILVHKKVGDIISEGTPIVSIYYNKEVENIESRIRRCFKFDSIKKDPNPLIYKVIK